MLRDGVRSDDGSSVHPPSLSKRRSEGGWLPIWIPPDNKPKELSLGKEHKLSSFVLSGCQFVLRSVLGCVIGARLNRTAWNGVHRNTKNLFSLAYPLKGIPYSAVRLSVNNNCIDRIVDYAHCRWVISPANSLAVNAHS
jgi:hypothetical protein